MKAILVFEDCEDGTVDIRAEFDPPLEDDNAEVTAATYTAMLALKAATQGAKDE